MITTSLRISKELKDKVKETGMTYSFLIKKGLDYINDKKELNNLSVILQKQVQVLDRRISSVNDRISEIELRLK